MHDEEMELGHTAEDPFAGVEPDPDASLGADPIEDVSEGPPEERLGGEGAELGEDVPPPEEVLADPEAEATEEMDLEPVEGADALPQSEGEEPSQVEGDGEPKEGIEVPVGEEAVLEGEEPEPEQAPPEEEASAKPKAKKRGRPRKSNAKGNNDRIYVTLVHQSNDSWAEPEELGGSKRIRALNGDSALRAAYNALVPEGMDAIEIVCIPDHYWKPKSVRARERKDRAIHIG